MKEFFFKMINRSGVALACLGSAILFYLILVIGYSFADTVNGSDEVDFLAFGDSILGEVRDGTGIVNLVSEYLGEPIDNFAIGGSSMTKSVAKRTAYTSDLLCMYNLATAMESGDFGPQRTYFNRIPALHYEPELIERLEEIDFTKVKKIILCFGLNDYHQGVPIKNQEDLYDDTTFYGAYCITVERLKRVCPEAEIVMLTSTYSWYPDYGEDRNCENMDFGGGYLEEYVAAEFEIAEKYGIDIIDLYNTQYGKRAWYDSDLYTYDGIHPNELGRKNIAKAIFEGIR